MRKVVWFSCGAASAITAMLAVKQDSDTEVVYCNTLQSEHPDNKRFLDDIQNLISKEITIISSEKYKSIDEVFEHKKYLSGIAGAPCTREMKIIPRLAFQKPDDLQMFGFCAEEQDRASRFEYNYPEINADWPLINENLSKQDCIAMLSQIGIKLPEMYKLGYSCNNCIGCVKASSQNYWRMVARDFPEVFKRRCEQSRKFGARITQKTIDGKQEHIFLDEIDLDKPIKKDNEDISCGLLCQIQMNKLGEQ